MSRVPAAGFALVLAAVPVALAPAPVTAAAGLVALLLTAVGLATRWRWPVTAAAGVFLADYALALWLAGAPLNVPGAAGYGLSLLLLLQCAELARSARRAMVDPGVARALLVRWLGFGAATLGTAVLVTALAGAVLGAIPSASAPLVAAAGALGVVLALALALAAGRARGRSA
jgi:hypothetical protein